jgi:glycosyltransferase involved in cell wall biosynthesis
VRDFAGLARENVYASDESHENNEPAGSSRRHTVHSPTQLASGINPVARDPIDEGLRERLPSSDRPPTIGYLARLAPEKGLHLLVDAFLHLKQMPSLKRSRLKVAGWLGENHRAYAEGVFEKIYRADLGADFEYLGEVDRQGKLSLLSSIDVLSVPTTYREPKGLFVLEALAAGVPVVVPEHGAFPEVLAETRGGLLHRAGDAVHLAEQLAELLTNLHLRQELGHSGQQAVLALRNQTTMAQRTAEILQHVVQRHGARAPAALNHSATSS